MKKTLFILCALLLTAVGASAASTDYTSYLDSGTWTWDDANTSATNTYGTGKERYGAQIVGTVATPYKVLYETVTGLPAGTYVLTFYAVANNAWVGAAYGESIAQVYANETTKDITVYDQTTCTQSNYPHTLICTVGEDQKLEYGMQNIGTGGNWYVCEGVSLTLIDSDWTGEATAHKCTATLEDWSTDIIVPQTDAGGKFQRNTWSTETDASGMVTPFLEYWVASGNTLPTATISHTQLTGLTAGYYRVSMDIRIFSEAGATIGTGTTFNVKGDGDTSTQSEDLDNTNQDGHEGTYETTKTEVYGTYTLTATVGSSGTLDISIQLPNSPTYNWIAWKNLDVVYMGETLEYNIGAGTADATCIKAGQEVTISFADCMYADGGAVLSSTATGTLSDEAGNSQTITLTGDGNGNYTFTVDESWDLAYNTTYTFTMAAGAVTWTYGGDTKFESPAVSITFTTPEMADITGVYLFNLGENEFLSRGHSWDNTSGTAADVDVYGLPVDITASSTGGWNIRYIDSNLYIGGTWWASADAALADAASFTLVTTDGTTTDNKQIYRFRNGSDSAEAAGDLYVNNGTSHGPLGLNDDDAGINSEADRQWVVYTKEERDELKASNVLAAKLATAQALDPSFSGSTESDFNEFIASLNYEDVTNNVGGASLATADDLGYWTAEYVTEDTDTGNSSGSGFVAADNVIETYDDVDDLTQTITGLEEGIYKVTLQGFNRMGAASYILANLEDYDISLATLGANDDEINLKTWASDRPTEEVYDSKYASLIASNDSYFNAGYSYFPNSQYQASLIFGDEAYQNELYTYVGNGSLTITIACPDYLGANWVVFTNLTLTRYYTDDPYTNDVTWKLANPSFEVDNVAYLEEDATRNHTDDSDATGSYTGGAYTIENGLTGWTLEAPTSETTDRAISDLLTAACKRTDNGYGAPGTPSNGDQMLYLRCAWESKTGSVTQTVSLPEGEYKLTVDSKCATTGSGHSATLVVGDDKSVTLPTHSAYSGDDLDWDTSSIKFVVGAGGEDVTIGVKATFADVSAGLSVALDNFKLYSAEEIEETIEWEMTSAGWGTLILPFAATLDDGLTAYSCDSTEKSEDDEGTEITVVTLAEVGQTITANTPYIIGGTANTYSFKGVPTNEKEIYTDGLLTGTLVKLAVATGAAFTLDGTEYLLQHHEDVDDSAAFYPIMETASAEATLDAYHCYLTPDSTNPSGARVYISFAGTDDATAIKAVEGAEAEGNGAIYDLSGRKVSKAVKGVYIQNGKKVLVK